MIAHSPPSSTRGLPARPRGVTAAARAEPRRRQARRVRRLEPRKTPALQQRGAGALAAAAAVGSGRLRRCLRLHRHVEPRGRLQRRARRRLRRTVGLRGLRLCRRPVRRVRPFALLRRRLCGHRQRSKPLPGLRPRLRRRRTMRAHLRRIRHAGALHLLRVRRLPRLPQQHLPQRKWRRPGRPVRVRFRQRPERGLRRRPGLLGRPSGQLLPLPLSACKSVDSP